MEFLHRVLGSPGNSDMNRDIYRGFFIPANSNLLTAVNPQLRAHRFLLTCGHATISRSASAYTQYWRAKT